MDPKFEDGIPYLNPGFYEKMPDILMWQIQKLTCGILNSLAVIIYRSVLKRELTKGNVTVSSFGIKWRLMSPSNRSTVTGCQAF